MSLPVVDATFWGCGQKTSLPEYGLASKLSKASSHKNLTFDRKQIETNSVYRLISFKNKTLIKITLKDFRRLCN